MKKHNLMLKKLVTIFVVVITILAIAVVPSAQACSRLVYQGSSNGPITARSMDWFDDPDAKLWVFPKGIERNGGAGENSIKWTSKYGSVVTSSYDIATVDGINEKGLVTNLLFLEATDYGDIEAGEKTLSIGGWGQYVLDNYATVEEAVRGLEAKPFQIVTVNFKDLASLRPNAVPKLIEIALKKTDFSLHMSLSDPSGDSAIVEYIGGQLKVHHGKEFNVLTNDPLYDQQLAINSYWNVLYEKQIDIKNKKIDVPSMSTFLPGTSSPSDRFVRASFYLYKMNENFIGQIKRNRRNELAAAFGIIRNVSDPLGLDGFSLGTTQWRAVASQNKNPDLLAYFFEYTKSPNVFWVEMKNLNLEEGADVMGLDKVTSLGYLAGEVSGEFEIEDPFSWDISSVLDD